MMRLERWVAALAAAGAIVAHAHSQTPQFSVDSGLPIPIGSPDGQGTYNSGSDVVLRLDQIPTTPALDPITGTVTVRIADINASSLVAPTASAGKITILGTVGTNGRVNIVVRSGSTAFGTDPRAQIPDPGLINLGFPSNPSDPERGIILRNPNNASDKSLEERTVFVGAVTGEITGKLTVGAIWSLQAGDLSATTPNGVISSDITACQPNSGFAGYNFKSIEYVACNDLLSGSVVAAAFGGYSPATQTGYADIGKVVVGTAETARGITGDIIAHTGSITSIFSTGPIGTAVDEAKIWASDGIDEIRIISENAASAVLDEDLFVNIDAGKLNLNPSSNQTLGPSFTNADLGPEQDGSIRLIETGGDLHGSVRATNLSTDFNETQHFGILVRGDIHAPITIDYMMNYADIIGRSIRSPIIVGKQLKGAIVAFGTPDPANPGDPAGTIHSVRVGLDAPAFTSAFGTGFPNPPAVAYSSFKPGLIGLAEPPHNISNADPMITWFPSMGRDGGTLDAVIRAEKSIGSVELASMSLQHPTGGKTFRPRVEAPVIGSLRVHNEIEAGSIWSGRLEFSGGQVADDIANNYASIGSLRVGCVGPKSDIWFRDCTSATADSNMLGELHLPRLNASEAISIGQYLGDTANACGQIPSTLDPSEQSPRGYRTDAGEPSGGLADRGNIFIREQLGLAGQIIINRDAPFNADGWKGRVMIGADQLISPLPSGTIVLDPTFSQPDLAPYYARLSRDVGGDLGGGAVGLVPYHLHQTDSVPNHYVPVAPPVGQPIKEGAGAANHVVESAFNSDAAAPVVIRSYGPLTRHNPSLTWTQSVEVRCRPLDVDLRDPNADPECNFTEPIDLFIVRGPEEHGEANALKLSRKPGTQPRAGVYQVVPKSNIRCDLAGTAGSRPQVVWEPSCDAESAFVFVIAQDCNSDGIDDREPGQNTTGCGTDCHVIDFNSTGAVTVQDLFDFLAAYFSGCIGSPAMTPGGVPCMRSADVNNSGAVSVQDIFDYLAGFFTCR